MDIAGVHVFAPTCMVSHRFVGSGLTRALIAYGDTRLQPQLREIADDVRTTACGAGAAAAARAIGVTLGVQCACEHHAPWAQKHNPVDRPEQ